MIPLGPLTVFLGWIMLSAVSIGLAIAVSFSGIF